jgi:predicted phage tail protein
MARRYSPDELDALLHESQRDATRPTPVTLGSIGAQVAQAVIAGVGAAALVGAGLWLLGAPGAVLAQGPLLAALMVTGAGLVIRVVPADKAAQFRRIQAIQRMVVEAEFRKRQAYAAIERLEGEQAARLAEMQRALNEAHTDLRNARMELRRAQEAAAPRRAFVAKSNVDPQIVRDAQTIIRHWFDAGAWYSRPKAVAAGWSEDRHAAAVRLLNDAGLVGKAGKLREVSASSLDDALRRLAEWRDSAETQPVIPPSTPVYVEPD